ncbi:MAG TPA: hypothetical protein VLJ68_00765 [Chitinophagaceae bacterium]|nr:hypothetical protein [Chitinophagaceae bacterium]
MKKNYILLLLLIVWAQFVTAQPTEAEIKKQIDDAMKKAEQMITDPKVKAALEDARKVNQQSVITSDLKTTGTSSSTYPRKLPALNTALLATISKKTFTKAELVDYCSGLYKQFAAKISPAKVKAVNDLMSKPGGSTYTFNLAAVSAWYNGGAEEAILLAAKAATQDPDDDVMLNNLSAMLNMGGLEQKAIPILKTLLQKYPENPMALNNMGQAYEGLGAVDTAMLYLGRCIAKSPHHPEANNTAGEIELSKGNREKAKEHFENSLKGAYTKGASAALRYLDPQTKYSKFIRPRVHIPEYFNFYKYKLPPQCENWSQAPGLKALQEGFKEMLTNLIKKYDAIQKEESALTQQILLKKYAPGNVSGQSFPPFLELGTMMLTETSLDYANDLMALDSYNQNFKEEIKKLDAEYQQSKLECAPAANKYLPLFANLRRDWQIKNINVQKKYLDEMIYWTFLASHNIHDFRKSFYALISSALTTLHELAETKLPYYGCDWEKENKLTVEEPVLAEPECPFSIEYKFIAGKIALDCDKFSFSVGEGGVLKYERNFRGGQSTLSLGIGYQYELGGEYQGVKAGTSIGASECLFISMDGNGHITDAGLKFKANASAGGELDREVGESIKIKKDMTIIEVGVGYTIGIESGIKFDEGPLKNLINPPEKQLNKNVPIYKPGG